MCLNNTWIDGLVTVMGPDGTPTKIAASALNMAAGAGNFTSGLYNSNLGASGRYV